MDRNGIGLLQRVAQGTMRAGVLYGSRDIRLEEFPRPKPGAGQVLLRAYNARGFAVRTFTTSPTVIADHSCRRGPSFSVTNSSRQLRRRLAASGHQASESA